MIRWAIGGTAMLAAAAGLVWVGVPRTGPQIVVNAPVVPEPAPPVPPAAAPAVLARVVDVTDIDPLLDPPPIPAADAAPAGPVLTAVGYEEPAPPATAAGAVPPIPPAVEDEAIEVAPMPREVVPPVSPQEIETSGFRCRVFNRLALPAAPAATALSRLTLHPVRLELVGDVITGPAVTLGELPVPSVRAGWYGEEWSLIAGPLTDFWAEWSPFPPDFARPPHTFGTAVFF